VDCGYRHGEWAARKQYAGAALAERRFGWEDPERPGTAKREEG